MWTDIFRKIISRHYEEMLQKKESKVTNFLFLLWIFITHEESLNIVRLF